MRRSRTTGPRVLLAAGTLSLCLIALPRSGRAIAQTGAHPPSAGGAGPALKGGVAAARRLGPDSTRTSTCAEMEAFLRNGRIVAQRAISKGVTLPRRATLEYRGMTHDAALQTIDIWQPSYQTALGTELNFRDTWKFNVAGYELSKILELNMVPPYVERSVEGRAASFSWWVDDAMMELDRKHRKLNPPDLEAWNKQMYAVRVWHELIYDTDPNLTNLLITKDWQLWIIDFTRAFRLFKTLRDPRNLVRCDRNLLTRLSTLNKDLLRERLSRWLKEPEIDALVARAAKIVNVFTQETATKGEEAVLYDFPRSHESCGAGL